MPTSPDTTRTDRTAAGVSALAAVAAGIVSAALYFVYDGPPPADNVITRNLLLLAMLVGYLVLALALGRLLRGVRGGDAGLSGAVAVGALLTYAAVQMAGLSLEVGTSLQHPDGSLDPTVDGPLAAGVAFIHGPIAHVLFATFLLALVAALAPTGLVRRWVLTGSVVVALVNLAVVPAAYFGMDAAFFYAVNGWGSDALVGVVQMIWVGVLGGAILRSGERGRDGAGRAVAEASATGQ